MAGEKKEWLPASAWNVTWEKKSGVDAMLSWLKRASKPLYFPPDRRRVRRELQDHIDERVEGLQSRGLSLGDARRETLKRMGDPEEVGALLRQVHKPGLGWALRLARIVTVVLLLIAVFQLLFGENRLPFMTESQIMNKLGLATGKGNDTVTRAVIMERPGHCDEEIRFGSFTVSCQDVICRCVQLVETGAHHPTELQAVVLLRFTAAPWVRLPRLINGISLSVKANGKYTHDIAISAVEEAVKVRPWAEVQSVRFYCPYDADQLEICLGFAGEEQKFHISLDDWEARDVEALSDTLQGSTDWLWSLKELSGFNYKHVARQFSAKTGKSGETQLSVYRAALNNYEMISERRRGYLMDCTLIFRGDTMLLPMVSGWLQERLQIIDRSAGPDAAPVQYTVVRTALCRDLFYCRVVWEASYNAQYELQYRQSPEEEACVLVLSPEKEARQ